LGFPSNLFSLLLLPHFPHDHLGDVSVADETEEEIFDVDDLNGLLLCTNDYPYPFRKTFVGAPYYSLTRLLYNSLVLCVVPNDFPSRISVDLCVKSLVHPDETRYYDVIFISTSKDQSLIAFSLNNDLFTRDDVFTRIRQLFFNKQEEQLFTCHVKRITIAKNWGWEKMPVERIFMFYQYDRSYD
jgi:hypothetical protein